MKDKTSEDEVVKIALIPCPGGKTHSKDHIFGVWEFYKSGKQLQHVDFMTVEQAEKKYKPLGIEVIVTQSHGWCPDCIAEGMKMTKEEVFKEYFRNYRGN